MKLTPYKSIFREQNLKTYFKEISDKEIKVIEHNFNYYYNKLVPNSGIAETEEGEMLRAIGRLIYRYRNDGDYYFRGYGRETAGASAQYLANDTPISKKLRSLLNKARSLAGKQDNEYEYSEKDMYQHYLYEIAKEIVKYVQSRNKKYSPNTEDSR